MPASPELPIDSLLPELAGVLASSSSLVIEAPPGAGKTTRVPPALLDQPFAQGDIIVLEPRRLPATMAAVRVAEELHEQVGQRVGYTVRFENTAGPSTRLRFMTEGILLRRLLGDPLLRGTSVVILDEFHERHLSSDLALAWLARLQRRERPDLRIVVMSATLESGPVREFLGGCPSIRSEGRAFSVAVEYGDDDDDRMLASRVATAVRRLYQNGCPGDVLVFLPGAGEIRRAGEILGPWALQNGAVVLPLHGDLGPAEQRRAVSRCSRRKVILSTNVAETSLTIDGVVAVVDSGLARLASHSPWSGLPRVAVGKISQASAIQRAGRAGRTCPGQVVRLYSRQDFDGRRPFDVPEIGRLDLSEALLTLAALGVANADQFAWFEPPPAAALAAADDLLRKLGALDNSGRLTTIGREMLRFPAHPRLARLLVEGQRRGVGEAAAALAGIISEGDISQSARARFDHPQRHALAAEGGDLLERLDRFEQARSARFAAGQVRGLGLDGAAVSAVERARRQYAAGLAREGKSQAARPPASPEAVDAALARATLAAFPDRVMKRRGRDAGQAVLVTGGAVETPALPAGELLVAVDVEERGGPSGRPGGSARQARLAVAIEPDWLLDQVPEGLDEVEEMLWNGSEERVELVSRLSYGAVVLLESRRPAPPSTQASRCLAEVALATETEPANSAALLTTLKVKLDILRTVFPELAVPAFDPEWVRATLIAACAGITSLAELRIVPIGERLQSGLGQAVLARLRGDTPDHIALGRRQVAVNYQPDRHPWIEARLQDFFGMKAGPAICRGRLPLTMHLLAPNRRAVQVTSDLAGFWQRHYPAIRQELCRRYPRHAWPEDGASAVPPVSPARR